MKIRTFRYLLVSLALTLFAACQPTPEKEPVKNQQEDYINSVVTMEGFERTDAPAVWNETIVSKTGYLTIAFAAEIVVPEVETYSIYEMEQRLFTDKEALAIVDGYNPKAKLIERPVYTKDQWIQMIAAYDKASKKSGKTSPEWLEYAMRAMESAPDEYTPVPFSIKDAKDGVQYVACFENDDGTYSVVSGTRNGDDISYTRDNELAFLGLSAFEPGEDSAWLLDYEGEFEFSQEEALKTALEVLEVYGITDVELLSAEKMCTYKYELLVSKGWDLIFTHRSDGLPAIFTFDAVSYGGTSPLPTLCSPWGEERIEISVDEYGLICANIQNLTQFKQKLAENVKLVPFAELKDSIAEHLMHTYAYASEMIEDSVITITRIELCASLVQVKDDATAGRLMPSWKVFYEYTGKNTDSFIDESGQYHEATTFTAPDTIYFSALDGTYIEPRVTTRDVDEHYASAG